MQCDKCGKETFDFHHSSNGKLPCVWYSGNIDKSHHDLDENQVCKICAWKCCVLCGHCMGYYFHMARCASNGNLSGDPKLEGIGCHCHESYWKIFEEGCSCQ